MPSASITSCRFSPIQLQALAHPLVISSVRLVQIALQLGDALRGKAQLGLQLLGAGRSLAHVRKMACFAHMRKPLWSRRF